MYVELCCLGRELTILPLSSFTCIVHVHIHYKGLFHPFWRGVSPLLEGRLPLSWGVHVKMVVETLCCVCGTFPCYVTITLVFSPALTVVLD